MDAKDFGLGRIVGRRRASMGKQIRAMAERQTPQSPSRTRGEKGISISTPFLGSMARNAPRSTSTFRKSITSESRSSESTAIMNTSASAGLVKPANILRLFVRRHDALSCG